MSKFCNLRYSLSNENGLVEIVFSIKPNFFQKIAITVVHIILIKLLKNSKQKILNLRKN